MLHVTCSSQGVCRRRGKLVIGAARKWVGGCAKASMSE